MEILNLDKTKDLLVDLQKLDIIGASMNQLGRSVYAFCIKGKEKEACEIYNTYKPGIKTFKLTINKGQTIKFNEKRKESM